MCPNCEGEKKQLKGYKGKGRGEQSTDHHTLSPMATTPEPSKSGFFKCHITIIFVDLPTNYNKFREELELHFCICLNLLGF